MDVPDEFKSVKDQKCLILPEGRFRVSFDLTLLFLLMYIAFVTPVSSPLVRPVSAVGSVLRPSVLYLTHVWRALPAPRRHRRLRRHRHRRPTNPPRCDGAGGARTGTARCLCVVQTVVLRRAAAAGAHWIRHISGRGHLVVLLRAPRRRPVHFRRVHQLLHGTGTRMRLARMCRRRLFFFLPDSIATILVRAPPAAELTAVLRSRFPQSFHRRKDGELEGSYKEIAKHYLTASATAGHRRASPGIAGPRASQLERVISWPGAMKHKTCGVRFPPLGCGAVCAHLQGFFIIDVVSSIPFDMLIGAMSASGEAGSGSSSVQAAKTLKTGKILKVTRILKLVSQQKSLPLLPAPPPSATLKQRNMPT